MKKNVSENLSRVSELGIPVDVLLERELIDQMGKNLANDLADKYGGKKDDKGD